MAQPMGLTLDDIVFDEATPEQQRIALELRAEAYPYPHEFIERERHLTQHELTRSDCRQWVLYLKGYPRQIIASCEAIRQKILVSDGTARESYGYTIRHVFTTPVWRRLGMAAYLLRYVKERMDEDSECSVFFSDSGREYYTGLGWLAYQGKQANLILLSLPQSPPLTPIDSPPQSPGEGPRPRAPSFSYRPTGCADAVTVDLLRLEDLPLLCKRDNYQLSARFRDMPSGKKTHVAFAPTYARLEWQLARAEFDAVKMTGKTITYKGAKTGNSRSWLYWAHDIPAKKLRILRIVHGVECQTKAQKVADTQVLLEAALAEAKEWGLPRVVLWNPDEDVITGCKAVGNRNTASVKVVFYQQMGGCVPSLRWKPSEPGVPVRVIEWEDNYAYCLP
ncbi:uncharacterized protein QC761_114340 [Podospora bellae-mahoneyi]|uniref:LYC1 C-terminal domain-containing protein n=1 Tax=Podospora bellae-mahoneyi TaxID=2093777 RepID=A0ABR0FZM0_9PEZI|nr:hypothetical protein QC761_114340 [Podospora bellae-mahoneyi]